MPKAILMTDRKVHPDPRLAVMALPRGALVILRDYDARDRKPLALSWRQATRGRGILLAIAGDPVLARAVKADGVHWPQALIPKSRPQRRWRWTSAAVHDFGALKAARSTGVDAVLIAPIFATQSHPGAKTLGLTGWRKLARGHADIRRVALGGLDGATARRLVAPRPSAYAAIRGWVDDQG